MMFSLLPNCAIYSPYLLLHATKISFLLGLAIAELTSMKEAAIRQRAYKKLVNRHLENCLRAIRQHAIWLHAIWQQAIWLCAIMARVNRQRTDEQQRQQWQQRQQRSLCMEWQALTVQRRLGNYGDEGILFTKHEKERLGNEREENRQRRIQEMEELRKRRHGERLRKKAEKEEQRKKK